MTKTRVYNKTVKFISELYSAESIAQWIKKVIKTTSANFGLYVCREKDAIDLIRELNDYVKNIPNIEGYFIFNIGFDKITSEYSLLCTYARLPKTVSLFSWIVAVDDNLSNLIESVRNNKNVIMSAITDIVSAINQPQS